MPPLKTHCKYGHAFTPENTTYHKDSTKPSGRKRICLACERLRRTTDQRRAWKREWHRSNIESVRNTKYKTTYGITLEEYNKLLEAQDGKCAACGETDPKAASKRTSVFPVDHDHETDKVRGILCMNCNRVLGLIKDSIPALQNLITYLQKHQ